MGAMTEDPRWLSTRELQAWTRLEAVAELLPAALDQQLQRDADLSHYDYLVLAKLSEAPDRTLRMSHVAARLEARGYLTRARSADDRRATLAALTDAGWAKVVATAPSHVAEVRRLVVNRLTPEQVDQLDAIALAVLGALDPENRLQAQSPLADPSDACGNAAGAA
jgi:DNA-binding MarR family transcriptional regulator